MKHLCVFDLDDTLLSPDNSISSDNRAALGRLRDLDIGITIATGRSPFMTGKYVGMFTCGALGIAMGNSRDNIKAKARYVTGTCSESGVAQGIYKYVLPYFGLGF